MVLHSLVLDANVDLIAVDDLEAGTRSAPEISVRACSGDTKRWALRLALAVLAAADHVGDEWSAPGRSWPGSYAADSPGR